MLPANVDFTARQGSVFSRLLTITDDDDTPIPMTGYVIRGTIRKTARDPNTGELGALVLALAEGSGFTWLDRSAATCRLKIPATTTAGLPSSSKAGWIYDIELVPPSGEDDAFAILSGAFIIDAEATASA